MPSAHPLTSRADRVWRVDPERHTIDRFRSPDRVDRFFRTEVIQGEGILDGFELLLSELFS